MQQLFLNSQHLLAGKVLSTGSFDVSQALQKCQDSANAQLSIEADLPSTTLSLQWSESVNPLTFAKVDFAHELIGAKLAAYKFHYVGQFHYGDQPVNGSSTEAFSAVLGEHSIHNHQFESYSRCNCSWLLDVLNQAENGKATDKLRWYKSENGFILSLSRQTERFIEEEKFIFSSDFSTLSWLHEMHFK
jgi:hypothetical protein